MQLCLCFNISFLMIMLSALRKRITLVIVVDKIATDDVL
jgi:hypothetical protein